MLKSKYLLWILFTSILSPAVFAEDEDWDFDAVITATGGIAFVDADLSDDLEIGLSHYDYDSSESDNAQGLWGLFAGVETQIDENWDAPN